MITEKQWESREWITFNPWHKRPIYVVNFCPFDEAVDSLSVSAKNGRVVDSISSEEQSFVWAEKIGA
jgi:hypothetical protein